ncbi:MAG TPA: dTDP-glucose 4,6-dehydratase [Candidatus Wujingus californicus]|uniref:dTDP-glucose 4,6-dehydratase n=1 Tax=Candidatus Wujingus californicus TaxID=3367618 RepID=UPI001DBCE4FA|nr:dTDP-glucose 4,6-dehydratase [Planctomycetota bacterium]MDO8132189.1 dTDP-glucose 4,6-dehydratase [Candidatus Brocadiales bacterium]
MSILITGGAGFIGRHFALRMVNQGKHVVVLDKLTYAGNIENLNEITGDENKFKYFKFYKGDICNQELVGHIFSSEGVDVVINFAAETHVDRSIMSAGTFIDTDIKGVFVLLEASKRHGIKKFIQVSTDEVYGTAYHDAFKETDTLNPSNPYSASKTGGDRLAYAYWVTYKLPIIIIRASNNYGAYQHPEKFIPLFITNALEDKKLPLYGDGQQIRDWIHVEDHCAAIDFLIVHGKNGEVYNIGGGNERCNIDTTYFILDELNKPRTLIEHVKDREGHDRRYALDCTKIMSLGWKAQIKFETGLRDTIKWYKNNQKWWKQIKNSVFVEYYNRQYAHRFVNTCK